MAIRKYLKHSQRLLQESQRKLEEIKEKIYALKAGEEQPMPTDRQEEPSGKNGSEKDISISLSFSSAIKATLGVLLTLGLAQGLDIIKKPIILFLVALFFSSALQPSVDWLEKRKIPRAAGVLIMYLLVIGVLTLLFSLLVPIVGEQIKSLGGSIKDMIVNVANGSTGNSWLAEKIRPVLSRLWENVDQEQLIGTLTNTLQTVGTQFTSFAGNAFGAVKTVFSGVMNVILVIIVTFFMTISSHSSSSFFHSLFPKKYSGYISAKSKEVSYRMGEWIQGQLILAFLMGLLTFTVFGLIGVKYALTLAMIAALAEFIPYLGPLVTLISASLIAVNQSPIMLLWVAIGYAFIQFVESNILVPLVMGRSVGMNPVVVMFSLLAGASLGNHFGGTGMGLVGMIISVPVANIVSIFVEDYTQKNK